MNFIKLWLVLLILLPPPTNASVSICSGLFGGSAREHFDADALHRIIRNQAQKLGLTVEIQSTPSVFSRWRGQKLFAQATEANFRDENFRKLWTEKVIGFTIGEGFGIEQVKHAMNDRHRVMLNRMVLRTLLDKGLEGDEQRIKAAVHRLRYHPAFRLIFLWQLPHKIIKLTDDQVASLIQRGTSALESDPALLRAVEFEHRELLKRRINSAAVLAMGAILMIYYGWETYPMLESAYDEGREKAVNENTQGFLGRVEGLGQINSDTLALQMAEAEVKLLISNFAKKFGEEPTQSEAQEIRSLVCRGRYSEILSPMSQVKCLGLQ